MTPEAPESVQMIAMLPHELKQHFKLLYKPWHCYKSRTHMVLSIQFLSFFHKSLTLWESDFPGTISGYTTNNLISLLHAHS